jgi:hypothetical protein
MESQGELNETKEEKTAIHGWVTSKFMQMSFAFVGKCGARSASGRAAFISWWLILFG